MSSDGVRHLLDVADLTDAEIAQVLSGPRSAPLREGAIVGLVFPTPSLRTRIGFAVAAHQLGANVVSAFELRSGAEMSAGESITETMRAMAQMVDLIVVRPDDALDRTAIRQQVSVPVVNGGDPGGEHPTQALIDVAAMERFAGPLDQLHVAICGDLTMRASRSLLAALSRRPPKSLTLIAPESRRGHGVPLSDQLTAVCENRDSGDFAALDVVLLTGLAPGRADELGPATRDLYALNGTTITTLETSAVVLSPGPVIDEIGVAQRDDVRVRVDDQARLGVAVRTAVLQLLLDPR